MLYDIWMAETQPAADRPSILFLATFAAKFPAATTCSRQGPGRALDLLRLSGRALDPHPDHEPGRVDIRHRPAPHEEDERRGQPGGRA